MNYFKEEVLPVLIVIGFILVVVSLLVYGHEERNKRMLSCFERTNAEWCYKNIF